MNHTAGELARHLGAKLTGDAHAMISGLASPERARATDLIYIASLKHWDRAAASTAACVLVLPGIAIPGKTMLEVADPKFCFVKANALLLEQPAPAASVHATAIIAPDARLAADVTIGPYVVIENGVTIGAGTSIGAFCFAGRGAAIGECCCLHARVTLYAGARIGNRVEIHSGVVIGSDGFGYVFGEGRHWKFPQTGIVEIGDDVEIGANATIDRGSLDDTRIAEGVKLDNLVHVGHNVQIGAQTVIAAQTGISGSSVIGRHVIIGGQVGIADHCRLEDEAVAGAQAGIPTGKTIRSKQTVWGTPAREIGKFKEAYAWYGKLPELASRIKALEARLGSK